MAHNDYARPDGMWLDASVPTPGDLRSWDEAQYRSVNAAEGSVWSPTSPITIGGAGVHLIGGGHLIDGGITTRSGGRIVHADNDWATFGGVHRTHDVLLPLASRQSPVTTGATGFGVSLSPLGLRALVAGADTIVLPIPKRFLHHGATFASAVLTLYIGQQHAAIPATNLPVLTLWRVGAGTGALSGDPLKGSGGTPTPSTLPTPADPTAYYAGGLAQQITLTTNQFNVVDTTAYQYFFLLTDEFGAGALPGNVFTTIALHYTDILDMHFE